MPLTLSLAVSDDRALRAYAETIAAYWRDLGIGVDLVVLPFVRLLAEQLDNHSFDAALVQVSGLEGDPDPFRFWHSSQTAPSQLNYGGWSNPYADGLMERSRIELDAEARRYLLHRFQDVFLADLPALPISSPVYAYGVHGRVRNVQVGQLNSPEERLDTFANWFIATTRVTIWEGADGFPR
jgi:ABC-type transport system substrate-binding protein